MADINVDDITNSGGTGVFDRLMTTINSQIETQFLEQRITGSEYATVYLGAMQAALSQSIQFAMQEELTEAQIAGIEADNLVKAKQLEIAELEREAKQYEVDNILPEQLTKIQEEIDLLETQDLTAIEQIKSIYADRVLKDKQAAKLGLDNVMKTSEASRDSDPSFVYTPNYEE